MTAFHVEWLAHLGDPVPELGPLLQDLYLQYVHRPDPHQPGPDMGRKIDYLVRHNLIGDEVGLIQEHADVLHQYRTVGYAVPKGHNRYLLKSIEVALADLHYQLPEDQWVDNNWEMCEPFVIDADEWEYLVMQVFD
jgi:hypothetical protein